MKKGLLLFLGMLMMVSTVEATDGVQTNSKKGYHDRYGAKPIKFFERGIKFFVYPNGEFDFNTNTRSRYRTQYVYRNGKRYKNRIKHNGVRVSRDYYGRIKSIGNVYINYNRRGKVSRIGSVFVDYHRGKIAQIGGLKIRYSHYGDIRYYGQVKYRHHHGTNDFIASVFDYNDDFFYDTGFYNDYEDYGEDDDYYYYKSKDSKGLKKGHQKGSVIKRKKLKKSPYKERKRRS